MLESPSSAFGPSASWERLRLRADLLRRLRAFFDARGFLEVETPILSADTVVDRHLDPFSVDIGQWAGISDHGPGGGSRRAGDADQWSGGRGPGREKKSPIANPSVMWLQTSPEFAMKRLLAAGAGPIYQVARVFRLGELGPLHNPEFTMVEWYRPGDGISAGMQLTSDLCETLLGPAEPRPAAAPAEPTAGTAVQPGPAGSCRFVPGPAERISYGEAFERFVGVDPHAADKEALAAAAKRLGIEAPATLDADDRDGWLDLLLVERVQPHLGQECPTLVYDFPASQAALACIRRDKPPMAERFELYVAGIELANGYHELRDAAELRARNARVNAQRLADGKPALPAESRLLAAMEAGLPPMVGVALGFDRLVMLAASAHNIAEVISFPFDRA